MSFNALFAEKDPVIFAFHNNRWLIHTQTEKRPFYTQANHSDAPMWWGYASRRLRR
jgi:phosphoketolase